MFCQCTCLLMQAKCVYAKSVLDIEQFSSVRGVTIAGEDDEFHEKFATGVISMPWQKEVSTYICVVYIHYLCMYTTCVCTLPMYVHYLCMYTTCVCTLPVYVHYLCMYTTYVCMYTTYVCTLPMYVCTLPMYVCTLPVYVCTLPVYVRMFMCVNAVQLA